MSNSHMFLPSGFIRTPLQNGLGRYIPQLQRITLKFCKNHGGSRGVRYIKCALHNSKIKTNYMFCEISETLLNLI